MLADGSLFGTTTSGGPYEDGTAFRLAADGSVSADFIFDFTNGAVPGALIAGRDGNLYGTTIFGGSNRFGTVFRMTTNLALTTLISFNGTNGNAPTALIQGDDGNFYGLTGQGGRYGFGNVFELKTNGDLLLLYDFTGGSDGYAGTSLIQGKDGNFYGATSYGGDAGRGNIFKLSIYPLPNIQTFIATGHSVNFSWAAVPNFTYDVFYVTNLTQTNWSKLRTIIASNLTETVLDSPLSDQQRFYRVFLRQ